MSVRGSMSSRIGLSITRLNVTAALLLCAVFSWPQTNSASEAKLIARAKTLSVAKLDAALPNVSFEQWLRTEAGAGAKFAWEVNDCGEQTGAPGQNASEIPTCVEADATLKDKRQIVIMIAVQGAIEKKVPKAQPAFSVFFAQLITPRETINIKKLSDFPAALVRTHEPTSNPEIAK